MKSIVKFFVVICFVAFFTVSQSQAQEKKLVTGNSVTLGFPIGDMENMYDMGGEFMAMLIIISANF